MPFPFNLPTTSHLVFSNHLRSSTHPSLPAIASTQRTLLRDVLKKHKRLPPPSQATNLTTVLSALTDYLPYLSALDTSLSGNHVKVSDVTDGEEETIDLVLEREVEVEWRATLSSNPATIPSRRATLRSLEYELFFVLATLAYTFTLLARNQLHQLYNNPSQTERTTTIQQATKHLLQSASIHNHLSERSSTQWVLPSPVVDISTPVQMGLSSLALAESTLLAVLKDDPYASALSKDRDKNDNEWMIKAPEIPKVRAHLFARLCLAAAEHAGRATAMFNTANNNNKITEDLQTYTTHLHRAARGKACRFLGIDADLAGQLGTAIAWLNAAKSELGVVSSDTNKVNDKIERWRTKRKLETGDRNEAGSGRDAGWSEEVRIVEMLEAKWNKVNDTIHAQLIPDWKSLLATLPSGREICAVPRFELPVLDAEVMRRLRGMAEVGGVGIENVDVEEDDSDVQEGVEGSQYY
ncbi:MAG: hypothetical protein M1816_001140 [Peltula sp. TS41687]|nr:MAG: hypothetical protein M1816_001140 [Peltula sp. TS41687]